MKYFFIAGEISGDLHAARVIEALKLLDAEAQMVGWGGDNMHLAGMKLLNHHDSLTQMGFSNILSKLSFFRLQLRKCNDQLRNERPDVLVLVDFSGFNLRVAKIAKKLGISVCYYILPKLWAWGSWRAAKLKTHTDQCLSILPFEVSFFKGHSVEVQYVGNPSVEDVTKHEWDYAFLSKWEDKPCLAYLPGSRAQEISASLPCILDLAKRFPDHQILVAGISSFSELYSTLTSVSNIWLIYNKTYEVLNVSELAVITSGTATLEAALLGVPQIVVYRTGLINYQIAKMLLKINHISLVNLLSQQPIVTELIQDQYNSDQLEKEIERLRSDAELRQKIARGYLKIKEMLGNNSASKLAAEHIHQLSHQ